MGSRLEWVDSTGRGTLYSYTVVHRPQQPAFEVPYTVAVVLLEEGWHMLSTLIDVPPDKVGLSNHVLTPFDIPIIIGTG